MQKEYVYPLVGDRSSPKEWVEKGSTDIVDRAVKQTKAILDRHFPHHVPEAVDEAIRARFPVRLPREAMRARA
jgi:trimethylamine--corrinoid protein Co-methyltransferase